MSVQLIGWAYEQECGSGIDKAVLVALANRANHDTGECFPLLQRVADETEFGYSTVRKAIRSLVAKGFIERTRRRREDGSYAGYYYDFPHVRLSQSIPVLPGSYGPGLPQSGQAEPEVDLQREVLAATPRNGRPNPIWDALTEVFGDATTETARSRRGKVCRSLTAASATPDEILRRARSWPRHFDDATLTEMALEKHWDVLGRKPLRVTR